MTHSDLKPKYDKSRNMKSHQSTQLTELNINGQSHQDSQLINHSNYWIFKFFDCIFTVVIYSNSVCVKLGFIFI